MQEQENESVLKQSVTWIQLVSTLLTIIGIVGGFIWQMQSRLDRLQWNSDLGSKQVDRHERDISEFRATIGEIRSDIRLIRLRIEKGQGGWK